MFTRPLLESGQSFPTLPEGDPRWQQLVQGLDIKLDPEAASLPQLTRHAVGWVEGIEAYRRPWHADEARSSIVTPALQEAGLLEQIDPVFTNYDYVLVDGGNLHRYAYRLPYVRSLLEGGVIKSPQLVVFGGQSLRSEEDGMNKLAPIAEELACKVRPWAAEWLERECGKNAHHPDPWKRPFASEHEIGLLSLLDEYSDRLQALGLQKRPDPVTVHPSIPLPTVAAANFEAEGQAIVLLNAPAKIREHVGRKKPLSEARPTGRSCFHEWIKLANPPQGSTVLLITHSPNIFRSWFDMVLCAAEVGQSDLRINAAGRPLEAGRTVADVLVGLGDLIINFYNLEYEGGVDSPERTSFVM